MKPANWTEEMVDTEREKVDQLLLVLVRQTTSLDRCFVHADKGEFRWCQQSFLQEEGEVGDWTSRGDL